MRISDWRSDVCSSDLDLLLEEATSGQMRATELRAHAAGGFGAWPDVQSATFIFFYVIEGQVSFQMDDGSQVHLGRREAVHLSFLRHVEAVRYSADQIGRAHV